MPRGRQDARRVPIPRRRRPPAGTPGVPPPPPPPARRSPRGGGGAPHTSVMASRMTSTRLVGRTPELAELRAALAEAVDGRPSLAFVAGESGLGKTRLIA